MKVLDLLGRIKIAKPTYSALSETFKYLLKLCTDEDLEILVSDAKYLVKFIMILYTPSIPQDYQNAVRRISMRRLILLLKIC